MTSGHSRTEALTALAAACLILSACGTIMNRPRQLVRVRSEPSGASVRINPGSLTLTTPGHVRLRREQGPYELLFTLEGYEPRTLRLRQEISGWTWFGAMLTLGAGYLVDRFTGSRYELEPHNPRVLLQKQGVPPEPFEPPRRGPR